MNSTCSHLTYIEDLSILVRHLTTTSTIKRQNVLTLSCLFVTPSYCSMQNWHVKQLIEQETSAYDNY